MKSKLLFWLSSISLLGLFVWFIITPVTFSIGSKTVLYEPSYIKTDPQITSQWKDFNHFLAHNKVPTVVIDRGLEREMEQELRAFISQRCHRTVLQGEIRFWLTQMEKGAWMSEVKRWITKDFNCQELKNIAEPPRQSKGFSESYYGIIGADDKPAGEPSRVNKQ